MHARMPSDEQQIEALLATMFQAHPWHGVPTQGPRPGVYNAYIELVPTDTVKYELDKLTGHLRLDRPQRFSSMCPTLYGYLPQTYCGEQVAARCAERCSLDRVDGDGDPMDVCVLTEKATAHGNFLAHVRPIGGLRMIDGNEADDKIVAVLDSDITYGHLENIEDCPPGAIERVRHYFLTYKQQPGSPLHHVSIAETYGRDEALEMVARSQTDYQHHFGSPDARIRELRQLLLRSAGGV